MGAKRTARKQTARPRMVWEAMEAHSEAKFAKLRELNQLIDAGGSEAVQARAAREKMLPGAFEDKTPGPGEYMRGDNFRGVRGKATMKKGPR